MKTNSTKDKKNLADLVKALQGAKADDDQPHCWCVVESEWKRLWCKSKPEVASRVFVVANFNELPRTAMDWYRITYTAPFYYEFDGKKWNKINAFEPKGATMVEVKVEGDKDGE